MKKTIVLIFTVVCAYTVFAQTGFELNFGEENIDDKVINTFEVDGYYISSGKKYNPTTGDESKPNFYKISPNGEIITHVEYYKQDTGTNIRFGFQKPNGNLMFFGNSFPSTELPQVRHIHVFELNMDMELVWEKIDMLPTTIPHVEHRIKNYLITPENEVIIQGIIDSVASGHTNALCLYKCDMNGNILHFQTYPGWADHMEGSDMLFNADSSGFYLFGELSFNSIVKDWTYFDLELNMENSDVLQDDQGYFMAPVTTRRLADGRIIMANFLYEISTNYSRGFEMRIYDPDFNLLNSKIIYNEHQVNIPINRGMGFINEDNIWVATYEAMPPTGFMGSEDINFYVFDTDLNMKGTYTYEGDVRYWLFDLLSCSDGGCLVTGVKPEYEGAELTDNFVLKLALHDVITSTTEHLHPNQRIAIHPIPAKDQLTLKDVPESSVLLLYTPSGQLAASFRLEKGVNHLKIGYLPSGMYFATILQNQQLIQTSKFIKQ